MKTHDIITISEKSIQTMSERLAGNSLIFLKQLQINLSFYPKNFPPFRFYYKTQIIKNKAAVLEDSKRGLYNRTLSFQFLFSNVDTLSPFEIGIVIGDVEFGIQRAESLIDW